MPGGKGEGACSGQSPAALTAEPAAQNQTPGVQTCVAPLLEKYLLPPLLPHSQDRLILLFFPFSLLSATNIENELNRAMLLFWELGRLASHLPIHGGGGGHQAVFEVRDVL